MKGAKKKIKGTKLKHEVKAEIEQNHQRVSSRLVPARTQTLHTRPETQQSGQDSHTQKTKRKRSGHSEAEHYRTSYGGIFLSCCTAF